MSFAVKFQLIAFLALVAAVHGTAEVDSASCPEDDSSGSCHLNLLQGKSSFIFARQAVTSLADEECSDFGGDWIDEPHWYTPRTFSQTGCTGTSDPYTFTVNGNTVTMSSNFYDGMSGTLVLGAEKDTLEWSNGVLWERYHGCDDFGGKWIDEPGWYTPVNMVQNGCAGGYDSYTFNVAGSTIKMSDNFHNGMSGSLQTGADKDIIHWSSGATWERYHSCSDFGGSWIDEPHWYTPVVFTQQADCTGSGGNDYTFSVSGNTIQMSSNFHNGMRGTLQQGIEKDIINWASGATWEKYHPPPVDCQWDAWGAWTECSKTCGTGTQNRNRAVLVEASNNGNPCVGESTESSECNTQACPVNCVWEDWTDFSECSVSCGGGKQSRTRIEAISAANNGDQCEGEASQNQDCNTNACPTTSAPSADTYGDPHVLTFDAKDSAQ